MKRLILLLVFILAAVIGIQFVLSGSESESDGIVLESKQSIHVADEWQLSLTVEDASAGDTVNVALINGLQTFEEILVLGTGGVAVWNITEEKIIQAGESLILVQYAGKTVKESLTVQAGTAKDGNLFTTANTLPAYGEGSATVMFLAEDEWGNIPSLSRPFYLEIQYPDGKPATRQVLTYENGLGRFHLTSKGIGGRIRLTVDQAPLSTHLELMQTAGVPQYISLEISPKCLLNDGRDLLALQATVSDQNHYPVANGTLVKFLWSGGLGYGQTIDGVATLRLPAPEDLGEATYRASIANILSRAVSLIIVEDNCS